MRNARVLKALFLLLCAVTCRAADDRPALIVACGAQGAEAYNGLFERWATYWEKAAQAGGIAVTKIGADPNDTEPVRHLREAIDANAGERAEPLWLVLLGHGTDDGKEAKFNLRGADLGTTELAEWLRPVRRPLVLVCGFSASGAFLKALSGPNRTIVTATRSGRENNFARFGGFLSETIIEPETDIDKDGAVSLLEAWLAASRRTADFYKNEGRLATEHSLLDDNGDGSGTPADWFQGIRAVKRARNDQPPDGRRAQQLFLIPAPADAALPAEARRQRDALEIEIATLRDAKASMNEDEYFAKLEALLVQLARLYREGK